MNALFFALFFFVLNSTTYTREIKPHRLVCEKDSDCKLISMGGRCGPDRAINPKYEQIYSVPVDEKGKEEKQDCPKLEAKCENARCVAVLKK